MSAPPFALVYTDEARRALGELSKPAYAIVTLGPHP